MAEVMPPWQFLALEASVYATMTRVMLRRLAYWCLFQTVSSGCEVHSSSGCSLLSMVWCGGQGLSTRPSFACKTYDNIGVPLGRPPGRRGRSHPRRRWRRCPRGRKEGPPSGAVARVVAAASGMSRLPLYSLC